MVVVVGMYSASEREVLVRTLAIDVRRIQVECEDHYQDSWGRDLAQTLA